MSTPSTSPASAPCSICGGDSFLVERENRVATARACECIRPCRYCNSTGYIRTRRVEGERSGKREYEVLAPCHCAILDTRIAAFNKMGLPGVLAGARFENYSPRFPDEQVAALAQRALDTAKSFAVSYKKEKHNKGFIISGPVGSGKTHLLVATLRFLALEQGVSGSYTEISLLYATIRRGFQEGKSGGEIIQPLSEVDVLAIDELGRGRGSAFEQETMDELIARRYNGGLTTLFATNYSLATDAEKAHARKPRLGTHTDTSERVDASFESQLLCDRIGPRIFSRIGEMCTPVEMLRTTPDGRRARGETGQSRTYRGRT